jgi:malonyl-CoA O-methyltransferase
MKQKIIHYFNQGAKTYDAFCTMQTHAAKQLVTYIENNVAKKILEIGCGTGLLSQHLHAIFPQSSLLLTDIAPDMIDVCQQKLGTYAQIELACMDGEKCEIPTKFDLIASSMTMHWFEDLKQSIEKLVSKLLPGGCLAFSILGENSLYEWRKMCDEFGINKSQYFPEVQQLRDYFPEMEIDTEKKQYQYKNAYEFLTSLKNLGARASNTNAAMMSPKKLRALLRQYHHKIDMTYEIIYCRYKKC